MMSPFQTRRDEVGRHCHWLNGLFVNYMPTQLDHYKLPWFDKRRGFISYRKYGYAGMTMPLRRHKPLLITAVKREYG